MRQASLQLKMRVRRINVINNDLEKVLLKVILWSFALLAALYALVLGNTVFNILERRNLEGEARALAPEVATLELTYLSFSNNVDLDLSRALGFKETNPKFVTRGFLPGISSARISQNEI